MYPRCPNDHPQLAHEMCSLSQVSIFHLVRNAQIHVCGETRKTCSRAHALEHAWGDTTHHLHKMDSRMEQLNFSSLKNAPERPPRRLPLPLAAHGFETESQPLPRPQRCDPMQATDCCVPDQPQWLESRKHERMPTCSRTSMQSS